VEEGGRKIPQGVSLRKLEISSTAGLPWCSGVFLYILTTDFNTAYIIYVELIN
jgi:hypothetical protein